VRSPSGETVNVEDLPMVAPPDGLASSGPSGQANRGKEMGASTLALRSPPWPTWGHQVRESRWRSSVACFRGHRPASDGVGVGADTAPADPSDERGIVHNREGEGERAVAARPNRTRERPGSQPQQCYEEGGGTMRHTQTEPANRAAR
jgi:hypothetical protein